MSCGTSGGTTTLCSVLLALLPTRTPGWHNCHSIWKPTLCLPADSSLPRRALTSSSRPRPPKFPPERSSPLHGFWGPDPWLFSSWVLGSRSLAVFFSFYFSTVHSSQPSRMNCALFFGLVPPLLSFSPVLFLFVVFATFSFSSASFLPLPFVVTRV